jgi:4-hydroxybenzoate polyprenyltransferase
VRARLRYRLLRLEGAWWMMRVSIWMAIMAPAGSLAARHWPSPLEAAAAALATVLAGGLAVVINDILDRGKDEVTAPELPLPSGLVTLSQALTFAAFLVAVTIGLWGLASTSLLGFALALVVSGIAGMLVVLYSFVKPFGIVGPLVGGCAYATIPVAAWFAAGWGAGQYSIVTVIVYAILIGTGGIIHAAIRDVDSDAEVGNRTVAVRLGAERALDLGTFFYVCSCGCIIWTGLETSDVLAGVTLTVVAVAAVLEAHRIAKRRQVEGGTAGRVMRVRALRPATLSRLFCHVALIALISPLLALTIAVLAAALLPLQISGYRSRIYHGGLKRSLESCGGSVAPGRAGQLYSEQTR